MAGLEGVLANFWKEFTGVMGTIRFVDAIDVLAMAFIIYYAIRLVRETRAMQLVRSIGVILLVYFIAEYFSMITLGFFLGKVINYGLVVLVVLFQPELRRGMERIGRTSLKDWARIGSSGFAQKQEISSMIESVCDACQTLAARYEGALIVIERETRLGDIINTGTVVDAVPSAELITNLFFKNSPLHDGAMVIRDNRVFAAGCVLPLSDNAGLGKELGTRHRAALGMSEVSDAITIVVSEERGSISISQDSRLQRDLSPQLLKKVLESKLMPSTTDEKNKRRIRRRKQDGEDGNKQ